MLDIVAYTCSPSTQEDDRVSWVSDSSVLHSKTLFQDRKRNHMKIKHYKGNLFLKFNTDQSSVLLLGALLKVKTVLWSYKLSLLYIAFKLRC